MKKTIHLEENYSTSGLQSINFNKKKNVLEICGLWNPTQIAISGYKLHLTIQLTGCIYLNFEVDSDILS